VRFVKWTRGTFGSLRKPKMAASNERVTTVVGTNDLHIAVVQIASRLVCRIATFASEGDELRFGQRIGAIRFGSQVAGRTIVGVVVQSAPRSHHGSVRKIKIFIRNVRVAPGGPGETHPRATRRFRRKREAPLILRGSTSQFRGHPRA
jgi:hypothetical protein